MGKNITALNLRNKEERKKTRTVPLKNLIIQASTEKRYRDALAAYFKWMAKNSLDFPEEMADFDLMLSDYICEAWEDGEGRSLISNLLAGAQHFAPQVKRQIPGAWRLLNAWQRNETPARATPLTLEQVQAFSGYFLRNHKPHMAVGVMLAFHCLLRPGELVKLHASDFHLEGKVGVVNLGLTKSGLRQGAAESVTITDSTVLSMLRAWHLHASPGDPLLPAGPLDFRKQFQGVVAAFHLEGQLFKPYSLRRGGATHHFRCVGTLSQTCVRGRWSAEKTARIYINDGLATLAEFRQEKRTHAQIAKHLDIFFRLTKLSA